MPPSIKKRYLGMDLSRYDAINYLENINYNDSRIKKKKENTLINIRT